LVCFGGFGPAAEGAPEAGGVAEGGVVGAGAFTCTGTLGGGVGALTVGSGGALM
jgi:hypothetical protein